MPQPLPTVAIVGVGLIGGSLAAALRNRKLATVVGVGRDAERMADACARGLLDHATTDLAAAAREASLMVFCTPVDRIAPGVREAAAACRPGTILTDAGSVKGAICAALPDELGDEVSFLGSHPMAGSEKQGFEHADSRLFEDRLCILTPVASTGKLALERLHRFWQSIGMRTCEMPPEEHDAAVAEASHLPHLIAATLASTLRPEHRHVAASGFRDTTRVASGDPALWTAILLGNAPAVLEALDRQQSLVTEFRDALLTRDAAAIQRLLAQARTDRDLTRPF